MSYRFVDSFWGGPPWSCSKAVHKPVWHIPFLSVQWINSWWWTGELSETCRVSLQNKFVKLVHLVGFILKKSSWHLPVWWSFLSGKKQNFQSWDHPPQASVYQDLQTLERQTKGILPMLMITEMINKFLNTMKTRGKIIFRPYPDLVMKTKFFRTCPLSITNGSNYVEMWPPAL